MIVYVLVIEQKLHATDVAVFNNHDDAVEYAQQLRRLQWHVTIYTREVYN